MNQEKKPTLAFVVTVAIVAAVLVPTLYALSAGPAVFLLNVGVIDDETLALAYAPLEFVAEYVPEWVENRFEDYVDWWWGLADDTGAITRR
jgi:hypothetical protein